MDAFAARIEGEITRRRLIPAGARVLVAVSGGRDSMVLLSVLHGLAAAHGWKLVVAHFNHRLRGAQSWKDQEFVRASAAKLGLIIETGGNDVADVAQGLGVSTEMAGRELRHRFLAVEARRRRIRHVALAHHADDQAELFLLRLLRGAGLSGLAGMDWSDPSPDDPRLTLVRPLLGEPRAEITAYAQRHGVAFREDVSNSSTDILRNRIRHELLPLLRRDYQPAIDSVLWREMELLRAEEEFLAAETAHRLELPAGGFDELPLALQRRVLVHHLHHAGITARFDLIEQLRSGAGRWISVRAGLFCRRTASGEVEMTHSLEPAFSGATRAVDLRVAGRVDFARVEFEWSRVDGAVRPPRRTRGCEFFDAGRVGDGVTLRHWQPGDRFQPIGMAQPVKLQDLFVNAKILRAQRHELVVAATARGEIFWVEDLRIGGNFKVTDDTRRTLRWTWKRSGTGGSAAGATRPAAGL
jgi:tRNA(Ile)-lysidine synthase